MNKKEIFNQILKMIASGKISEEIYNEFLGKSNINTMTYEELLDFFKEKKTSQKITENGRKILDIMKEKEESYLNIFTSKNIGELLFMSPRSVSGSMKKLITDGYVEKQNSNPITYSLTNLGREI